MLKTVSIFLLSALLISTAQADTLTTGSAFPQSELSDAHGNNVALPGDSHYVLFAADMDAADLIKDRYAKGKEDPFTPRHAIYVADISGMPSLVSRFIAKPKMRKYPFDIALDEEGEVTAGWPTHEDSLTIFTLDHGQITDISYCATQNCLQQWVQSTSKSQQPSE